ncbi:MAG: HK97 family phage prohead protease [Chloroflexota bacterium]|nr:HK97 family phage prohead protease [Chloroflexota bacterium]
MQYKTLPMARVKAQDRGSGGFSGYVSTWTLDSVGDQCVKGCFAPHLKKFVENGFVALGHDWTGPPIGVINDAKEDDYGLFIDVGFHSTAQAQAVRQVMNERLQRGKAVKLSMGYQVLKDDYRGGIRLLKDVEIFEVSYVNVPANQAAYVVEAKYGPSGRPSQSVQAELRQIKQRLDRNMADEVEYRRALRQGNTTTAAAIRARITARLLGADV